MAQLVAHLLCKQGVRGSSPLGSTASQRHFRHPTNLRETRVQQQSTATVPAGGDAQWRSSRSPSAFNARKVESLVTWLYTSIVTAIWPTDTLRSCTAHQTSSDDRRDMVTMEVRAACGATCAGGTPRWRRRGLGRQQQAARCGRARHRSGWLLEAG